MQKNPEWYNKALIFFNLIFINEEIFYHICKIRKAINNAYEGHETL